MPLPRGIICLWQGAIGAIPAGWILCDGNNGTPDLRNRFLVGAGDTYSVSDTGGNVQHTHTFTGDGHNHTIPADSAIQAGAMLSSTTDGANATGTTDNGSTLPPYYSLAYIMKT